MQFVAFRQSWELASRQRAVTRIRLGTRLPPMRSDSDLGTSLPPTRSVESGPGRMLFFRIERSGPPAAARPVTSSQTCVHVPPTHGSNRLNTHGSRPPLGLTDTPVLLRPSLTASHPQARVGAGNVSWPLLRCRSGDPATDPHSDTRDSLRLRGINEQACGARA
jgi:hypothetical protein